jgi:hypothetical protein
MAAGFTMEGSEARTHPAHELIPCGEASQRGPGRAASLPPAEFHYTPTKADVNANCAEGCHPQAVQ